MAVDHTLCCRHRYFLFRRLQVEMDVMEQALIILQLAQVGVLSGIFFRLGNLTARISSVEDRVFNRRKEA